MMRAGALARQSEKTLNTMRPENMIKLNSRLPLPVCPSQRVRRTTPNTKVYTDSMRSGVMNDQSMPRYEPL